MEYIESETLELKEKYTDVICKEIVSFLNTEGGTLVIGVKDDGTVIGVEKVDETLKKISDVITMQIEPNPQDEIRSELKFEDGNTLIYIHVNQGSKNIYCQNCIRLNIIYRTIEKETVPESVNYKIPGQPLF